MSDPFVPAVRSLWWVQTTILPAGDPEVQRVAVVLEVPLTVDGTVAVVLQSGAGRRMPVQCRLWTASNVAAIGTLDDAAFAGLVERFAL